MRARKADRERMTAWLVRMAIGRSEEDFVRVIETRRRRLERVINVRRGQLHEARGMLASYQDVLDDMGGCR